MTKETNKEPKENNELLVSVKYNMFAPWVIKRKSGKMRLYQGDIIDLNLYDKEDLKAIIEVLKQVNNPSNTNSYYDPKDKAQPHKYRKRYEIISGYDNIPDGIKNINFKDVNRYDPTERETIISLVPGFFDGKKNIGKIRR